MLLQGIRCNQIQTTLASWSSDRGRDGARGGGVMGQEVEVAEVGEWPTNLYRNSMMCCVYI